VAQYPTVAPPAIVVTVAYPGASAKTLEDSVLTVIEQEMNGSPGLIYMESVAQANGSGTLTLTFQPGTRPDLAQVDVQNRLGRATPRLPQAVTQQGVRVDKARSNFLLFTILSSDDPKFDPIALGDYASRNVLPEIQRLPGVGQAQLFGTERAMRIWLDPAKLVGFNLSTNDVNSAIRAQNAQVSSGTIGDLPNLPGQTMFATVVVDGQLANVESSATSAARQSRRLGRAAARRGAHRTRRTDLRHLGAPERQAFDRHRRAAFAERQRAGHRQGRAHAHGRLQRYFPPGVKYSIPYDTSRFVQISISKVVETLLEAVVLVFLVMFLFLQSWRYTIIPTIVVPVALLGTFGVLLTLGFSINVLTMFGMVLVVGIVVDDAIVVVENVERIMSTEGLSPREATRKAMGQISGAIIGVTVVLISVFVPLAFFTGAVGNIYRQFSAVMAASIGFSAFLALSLTPALCATLLKPVEAGHHHAKSGFFGWFNRGFSSTAKRYEGTLARLLPRTGRMLIVYGAIVAAVIWLVLRLPTSFLPNEDQGYIVVNVQLPPGATINRSVKVMEQVEAFMLKQPEVKSMVGVLGFSFSGQGQNAALAFVTLKDWDERRAPGQSAQDLARRAFGALMGVKDAFIFPLSPPPIPELGNATGFNFRLQDRGGNGRAALIAARNQLLGMASQSKLLAGVRPDGLEDAPQLRWTSTARRRVHWGSASTRSTPPSPHRWVRPTSTTSRARVGCSAWWCRPTRPNACSRATSCASTCSTTADSRCRLSAFATTRWVTGPMQSIRYNGYPTMRIAGDAAPGVSSGEAMAEMERLAAQLPPGFAYEWTGQSREERLAGATALYLFGFSLLAVFLCLAALYESWSIPFSVILVVPLGVLGVVLGTDLRGFSNDVYFKIGLITIIGLSAKNAVLIIEFAKDLQAQGRTAIEAVLEAAHLRFRPIVMTSMAFVLGVLPLAIASGAGSASQRSIGTGVMAGMVSAVLLSVLFVPVFFVVVRRFFKGSERQRKLYAHELDAGASQRRARPCRHRRPCPTVGSASIEWRAR
jgi:multidrug efflux pump